METSPSPHNPVAFLLALLWFSWTETVDPCSNEDDVNFYQDLGKELINIPMVWFSSHMLLRLHVTKIHPAKKYFPRKAWEDPQNQAPQRPAGTLWEGQCHMTHKYTYIYRLILSKFKRPRWDSSWFSLTSYCRTLNWNTGWGEPGPLLVRTSSPNREKRVVLSLYKSQFSGRSWKEGPPAFCRQDHILLTTTASDPDHWPSRIYSETQRNLLPM